MGLHQSSVWPCTSRLASPAAHVCRYCGALPSDADQGAKATRPWTQTCTCTSQASPLPPNTCCTIHQFLPPIAIGQARSAVPCHAACKLPHTRFRGTGGKQQDATMPPPYPPAGRSQPGGHEALLPCHDGRLLCMAAGPRQGPGHLHQSHAANMPSTAHGWTTHPCPLAPACGTLHIIPLAAHPQPQCQV